MNAHPVTASLERVSEAHGDITGAVYARLFTERPELEAEFHMDADGGVRGSMLGQALECLIDLAEGEGLFASAVLMTERANHDGYGLVPGTFEAFFETIRDTVRALDPKAWSAKDEAAWAEVLRRTTELSRNP